MTYIPTRMCVGCRKRFHQDQLLRIVKDNGKAKLVDSHTQGRSIYLCRKRECILSCKKSHAIERGLKVTLDEEFFRELEDKCDE